ncbi:MAG: metallophosphoesterase [candidate division KSB1 bacterium]|nr:metallophosphoesterase [candidate division KSB1 bacterium]
MKVGILADSHDNLHALRKAVEVFRRESVGLVVHAGDLVAPFVQGVLNELECPLVMVFGNNDGERLGLARVFAGKIFSPPHQFEVDRKAVLLLHEPHNLEALKASQQFDAIIYGHTHKAEVTRSGRTLVINPGECGGWLTGRRTVAVWDTESGEVHIHQLDEG